MKVGLIRPFLLLVSMHPAMRCQIGMLLGWCGITRPSYGKPHQEAWDILASSFPTSHHPFVSLALSSLTSLSSLLL